MGATLERPQTPSRHRLDVDAYYKMAEAGILTRDDRVELIDGEIIDLNPIGSPHAAVTNRLARLFNRTVGGRNRACPRPEPAAARRLSTNQNPISCCCGPAPTSIRRVTPAPPTCFSSLKFPTARSPMTAARKLALYAQLRRAPRSGSSILPAPRSKSTAGRRRAPILRRSAGPAASLTPDLVPSVSIDVAALLA